MRRAAVAAVLAAAAWLIAFAVTEDLARREDARDWPLGCGSVASMRWPRMRENATGAAISQYDLPLQVVAALRTRRAVTPPPVPPFARDLHMHPPAWALDIEQLEDAPAPNPLGAIYTGYVLVAHGANDDAWTLASTLLQRPERNSVTAGIILAERLPPHRFQYERAVVRAEQYEAWLQRELVRRNDVTYEESAALVNALRRAAGHVLRPLRMQRVTRENAEALRSVTRSRLFARASRLQRQLGDQRPVIGRSSPHDLARQRLP